MPEQFASGKFPLASCDSIENPRNYEARKRRALTPYRLMQAFISAGCPAEAFGFYPTDHEGAADILRLCDRALIFGG